MINFYVNFAISFAVALVMKMMKVFELFKHYEQWFYPDLA